MVMDKHPEKLPQFWHLVINKVMKILQYNLAMLLFLPLLIGGLLLTVRAGLINYVSIQYLHNGYSSYEHKIIRHPRMEYWKLRDSIDDYPLDDIRSLNLLTDSDDPLTLGLLAQVYERKNNFDAAIEIWQELGAVSQLARIGNDSRLAGQFDLSIDAYYALWEIAPANGNITNLIHLLQKEQNDPFTAELVVRKALAAKPIPAYKHKFMVDLGVSLEMQERWDESLQLYNQILKEFPESSRAYYGLAHSLGKTQAPIESVIQTYQQVIVFEPDFWIAYQELGDIYIEQSQIDKAIAVYQDGFQANPKAHPLCYEIALVYRKKGEFGNAIHWIENALHLEPENPTYLRLAGNIYSDVNEKEKAIQVYRQLLKQVPGDTDALQSVEKLESK